MKKDRKTSLVQFRGIPASNRKGRVIAKLRERGLSSDDIAKLIPGFVSKRRNWTKEECITEARKFSSRRVWAKAGSSYGAAQRNGWLKECTEHMQYVVEHGKWTLEKCSAEASKFSDKASWKRSSPSSYGAARKHDWLDQCCAHMFSLIEHGKWTLETCKADAARFSRRGEWAKASQSAYVVAHKNGWLKDCCAHMQIVVNRDKWTRETCQVDAAKYQTRGQWKRNSPTAYSKARRNGWSDEICRHMPPAVKRHKPNRQD